MVSLKVFSLVTNAIDTDRISHGIPERKNYASFGSGKSRFFCGILKLNCQSGHTGSVIGKQWHFFGLSFSYISDRVARRDLEIRPICRSV